MDPLGWSPEQYMAAASWTTVAIAVVTLVLLVFSARFAARQFEEARRLRQDQSRPYIVPSIDIEQQMLFLFVVENIGRTAAFDVRIEFEEPPRSEMKDIEDLGILNEPIPTMPPGQRFRAYWESSLTIFSREKPYPHPLAYRVNVSYQDHDGNAYGPELYILDFKVFTGQATGAKGLPELVKAVEQLVSEHKRSSR